MVLTYKALATELENGDLDIDIIKNTLGEIAWSKIGDGDFIGTKNGFFDEKKTFLLTNSFCTSGLVSNFYVDSINTIGIHTRLEVGGVLASGVLYKHPILIQVKHL